jgi:aminopeptidase N
VEESNLKNNLKLTHWKEEISLPTKIMVIGVASFAVNYIGNVNDCIPVSSWVFPENKEAGFYDYAMAKDILNFYINYIGPYPYKKLANVQSKTIFGGMENAGAIFYHENSVVGHREEESLFAHEIVHQWFGDMASEQNFSHLWLSEGFATYLTHIYYETKYGTDEFRTRLITDRNEVIAYLKYADKPIVDSITPRRQLINTNNYARAGWVLHMLRNKVGDTIFHTIIRHTTKAIKEKMHTQKIFRKWRKK